MRCLLPRRERFAVPVWALLVAIIAPLALTTVVPCASAQEELQSRRASTEERLQTLKEQIERDQNRLEETTEAERASQKKLESLQREIALREELVSTYQQRLTELKRERRALRDTLQQLEGRLSALQDEYQARVRHAYKYNRIPDLALVLASRSVNQMLVRIRYLQRFAQQRQRQRSDVQQAAAQVRESREQLAAKQSETETLLAEARTERENLRALKTDREEVVAQLRARRSELKEEIEQKQSQARELEQQIREIVAQIERRRDRQPEAEQAEQNAIAANLSSSFEKNKGRLPWPAEGAVTEQFGNRVDPVHGTETYHPGILIATNPEEEVRSVFEGTVSGIDFVPGYGTYLVLSHGNYMSVYSNFSSLYVSQGESIEAGEVLGLAGTEDEPRGAGVFFAVFDRSKSASVNPTVWLSSQ